MHTIQKNGYKSIRTPSSNSCVVGVRSVGEAALLLLLLPLPKTTVRGHQINVPKKFS
jgi:hypothetical protein